MTLPIFEIIRKKGRYRPFPINTQTWFSHWTWLYP